MRIALVHEFLTQLGGAERVLEVLHEMFPQAPVYALIHDKHKTKNKFTGWEIKTSFLQKIPLGVPFYKWFLALMPKAIESFNLKEYDLVLSDSSAFAKGVKVSKNIPHICYCHTPTRYLWQMQEEYLTSQPYPAWALKLSRPVLWQQKKWDFRAAQKVTKFLANSQEVQNRIRQYYKRESIIVYPPVNTEFFTADSKSSRNYFFAAGRIEPYKRFDLVIDTAKKLNLPLKIAGTGSLLKKLKQQGGPTVEFLGRVSDGGLKQLYQNAKAFIFPAYEDAGIAILEALSCGTPVIAYGRGGAIEFVEDGKQGIIFKEQSIESLIEALKKFEGMKFNTDALRQKAEQFSVAIFKEKILKVINECLMPNN